MGGNGLRVTGSYRRAVAVRVRTRRRKRGRDRGTVAGPSVGAGRAVRRLLGDPTGRETVIVVINVARSVTICAAAIVAFLDAPAALVYALASVMGLLQSTFRPTQAALLPQLARSPEELTAANLVLTTIESVGLFIGPAIGGLLLAVTSTSTVFGITGGVFLLAALLLVGVHADRTVGNAIAERQLPARGVRGL